MKNLKTYLPFPALTVLVGVGWGICFDAQLQAADFLHITGKFFLSAYTFKSRFSYNQYFLAMKSPEGFVPSK